MQSRSENGEEKPSRARLRLFLGRDYARARRALTSPLPKNKKQAKPTPPTTKAADPKQAVLGGLKAGAMAIDAAKAHSFDLWLQNTNRTIIDVTGGGFSVGDEVVANGLLYASAAMDGPPIGREDFIAVVTSVDGAKERRHISMELDFYDGAWAQKHLAVREEAAAVTGLAGADGSSALNLIGVETCPAGGGVLRDPLALTIAGGTGAFFGARGQAVLSLVNAAEQRFKVTVYLA